MADTRIVHGAEADAFNQKTNAEKRAHYLERELAAGRRRGLTAGRSVKCAGENHPTYPEPARHAGDDGGCANDGTGCCCECHDPKEPTDA